jgi:hypothetical protein
MSQRKRVWLFSALGAFVLLALILSLTGNVRKLVQVVETDGSRAREYKMFGLIPWGQDIERVPELRIKGEAIAEMNKTVSSPAAVNLGKDGWAMKITRGKQIEYCTRFDFAGDGKAVADYYAKQLTAIRRFDEPDHIMVEGRAQDGSRVMIGINAFYKTAGGPVAGHDFMLKVTRD